MKLAVRKMMRGSIYRKSELFLIFICVIPLLQFYHVRSNLAEATSSSEKIVSIMAVGDSIGYNIENENLSNLSSIIRNSTDIFIFNLEGVLADNASLSNSSSSAVVCEGFPSLQSTFVSNSTFVDYLKLAPITIANLANNHVFDCGSEGVNETKKVLKEKNILSVGAGQDLQEACEPLLVEHKGFRIAFVSYDFMIDDLVSAQANRAGGASMDACNHDYNNIRLQKGADLIIASIHLGYWSPDVNEAQVKVVQHLFDSGVDMVIGHSPHMPQAIAATKGGNLAFFSLGNFILRPDYTMPELAHTTIVPQIDIYDNNTVDVIIYPVRIDDDGIPHLEEHSNNDIISRIAKDSDEFSTSIIIHDNLGLLAVKRYSE
jgi:poly-gamma-glutamate synthesis protein (capsule biosynthesis protein)